MRSPSPSPWLRLRPRARAFIGWLLLCCGAPALASVLLELTHGPSALGQLLPWLGFALSAVSVAIVVRPLGGSPSEWLEQLRARIQDEARR